MLRKRLLGFDENAKTVKGRKLRFVTGILYLAPSDLSGYQVCPMARAAGCAAACLNTAGLGGVYSSIQTARIAKTRMFFENRAEFMLNIVRDIQFGQKLARRKRMRLLIRLNGTSDIRWETISFVDESGVNWPNIMAKFSKVQFYDYTKLNNRRGLPENYDLTFSYSGLSGFRSYSDKAIRQGMRLAVVFRTVEGIPARFKGLKTLPGDNSDVRHVEPDGVVVALYAKGRARKDYSGFVVD